MRTNNVPVSILATALMVSPLQAFIVPEVALADWDQTTLASSAKVIRRITPEQTASGQYPGTRARVDVVVTASQECQQFWVVDNYMTNDLAIQGFTLVLDGTDAPQSLPASSSSGTVAVEPRISKNGKVLGFQVPKLLQGQQAGISYYIKSPNTRVIGNDTRSLAEWLTNDRTTNTDGSTSFTHLGPLAMTAAIPTSPELVVINKQGDATAAGTQTVSFDTHGGSALEKVIIEKRLSNALMSQVATPTREGYTFDGWFFDSAYTQPYDPDSIPSSDFTLHAKWVQAEAAPNTATEQHPETDPNAQPQQQAAAENTSGNTAGAASSSRNTSGKGDLVHTGADQTAAVIVTSASVIAGLSVLVLKKLQEQ